MAIISVSENNQISDNNKKSFNWFSKLCRFFKISSKSSKMTDKNRPTLESISRILTRRELDMIIEDLPEDSYETNANRSVYSLKITGKPFYIDYDQYNCDIYLHQTNQGNGLYFCDKHQDLMYILRILFYQQNITEVTPQELDYVLKVLPKSYYEVNVNQTIYSFKLNGKPFFIDKSHYNFEEYTLESKDYKHLYYTIRSVDEIIEETDANIKSKSLGEIYAERNRSVFRKFKRDPKNSKQKMKEIPKLKNNGLNVDSFGCGTCLGQKDFTDINDESNDTAKKVDKWSKNLAKRKVCINSDLMIQTISSKEAKRILSKCKETLFDWNGRTERRKRLELKAKLSSVNNCDLLSPRLYAISEAIEPNDVNHNFNH